MLENFSKCQMSLQGRQTHARVVFPMSLRKTKSIADLSPIETLSPQKSSTEERGPSAGSPS